ncbi:MAG TPA: phenylacetate--CoA ligase [Nitrospirota bacterium]|nr:phenylacetate--CoA ligase [Nitrospirota bacterium]
MNNPSPLGNTTYWQKNEETMSRMNIESLQRERLMATLQRAYEHVPFYRMRCDNAGLKPGILNVPEDLNRLPFTTSDDLRQHFPYGLLAIPREDVVRVHTSSGTTGKPKAVFFSKHDLDQSAVLIARCLVMTGTTKGDILQNMMTYGLFTGGLVMHYGAEKVGALVVPAGPGNSDRQIALMRDFETTVFHMTPSYALYLASILQERGINPRQDLHLKRAYLGAEPYSEETRIKIEQIYGIDVYNSYGLTEMNGPGVAFECQYKNGMHLWEDHFFMEIINPDTGEILEEGQEGELVLTSLTREAMPLIRYRTRDITKIIRGICECGRTHRRISRILGRSDDMFVVKGVNIFPQQIEQVLMGIKGVAQNYQIVLDSYDHLTVNVEISISLFDGNIERLVHLQTEIADKVRAAILVKPKVELHEPGSLPVSEGKAKRVIDNRTL